MTTLTKIAVVATELDTIIRLSVTREQFGFYREDPEIDCIIWGLEAPGSAECIPEAARQRV
jgi:hypothetical protein